MLLSTHPKMDVTPILTAAKPTDSRFHTATKLRGTRLLSNKRPYNCTNMGENDELTAQKSCVENIIDQFVAHLNGQGKSERTAKTYRYVLERFDRWLSANGGYLGVLTRFDVQAYVKHMEANGNSATTIGKTLAAISAFANYQERPDVVQHVRIPEVRKLRNIAPKSLERTDRNRVLREVERDGNVRDVAIVYTLLYTGLRVSELVALDREDVTIKERSGWLVVRNGKGNVARKVPLSAEVRLHLIATWRLGRTVTRRCSYPTIGRGLASGRCNTWRPSTASIRTFYATASAGN